LNLNVFVTELVQEGDLQHIYNSATLRHSSFLHENQN